MCFLTGLFSLLAMGELESGQDVGLTNQCIPFLWSQLLMGMGM